MHIFDPDSSNLLPHSLMTTDYESLHKIDILFTIFNFKVIGYFVPEQWYRGAVLLVKCALELC